MSLASTSAAPLPLRSRPVWRDLTQPAEEPITLLEAKVAMRVDHDEDDALITGLIAAARQRIERDTRRLFVMRSVESLRDDWFSPGHARAAPAQADLEPGPVTEITKIEYSSGGVMTELPASGYVADLARIPARLFPASGLDWPAVDDVPNAVVITYTAGWPDAASVPALWKRPVYLLMAHWYKNPEPYQQDGRMPQKVPMLYQYLLDHMRDGSAT